TSRTLGATPGRRCARSPEHSLSDDALPSSSFLTTVRTRLRRPEKIVTIVRCRASSACVPLRNTNPRRKRERAWNLQRFQALFGGTAYGIRTRVTGVKGRRPRPLDERGG